MGEFEDAWEDEIDDEEDIVGSDEEMQDDEEETTEDNVKVYLPGQPLAADETLEVDNSAYEMLHNMNVQWPCLSFDIIRDQLGDDRNNFPHTAYMVTGSQADNPSNNQLYVFKMSQLCRTKHDDYEEAMSDDDSDVDDDPILESRSIPHEGGINRIRAMPASSTDSPCIVATWSEMGSVNIFDLSGYVKSVDTPGFAAHDSSKKPIYCVESHPCEGFAMDWNTLVQGRLISGDCKKYIYQTVATSSGFTTDKIPFSGHTSSVEDLQWSPTEPTVFASCSSDGTLKIWDTRLARSTNTSSFGISSKISNVDVNVISWNTLTPFLIASGHDDGVFSIWDLRNFSSSSAATKTKNVTVDPAATFKWHHGPITSIEWHPQEESVLAVAGADDQITIWDFATERDSEEGGDDEAMMVGDVKVPSQLLFIHQGQSDIKELHWHKQIPGCLVSTAATGFNIFKTINS